MICPKFPTLNSYEKKNSIIRHKLIIHFIIVLANLVQYRLPVMLDWCV